VPDRLLIMSKAAAALLGISPRKLWSLTKCGEIPCVRIGRSVRDSVRSLEAWIERREAIERSLL
jgi:excisionase family DNA binding protein